MPSSSSLLEDPISSDDHPFSSNSSSCKTPFALPQSIPKLDLVHGAKATNANSKTNSTSGHAFLLPSPQMIRSTSTASAHKENTLPRDCCAVNGGSPKRRRGLARLILQGSASSSSSSASSSNSSSSSSSSSSVTSSSSPVSSASSSSLDRKSKIHRAKRRVIFSPTPLASLKASPKHRPLKPLPSRYGNNGNPLRPFASTGGLEGTAQWKKLQTRGVYSNHPFLGNSESSSARAGGGAGRVEGDEKDVRDREEEEDEDFTMPFAFPGFSPFLFPSTNSTATCAQQPRKGISDDDEDEDDDETDTATSDSETESDFVSSLLLHRQPSLNGISSSPSPIKPSNFVTAKSYEAPMPWLKSILKPKAIVQGSRAQDEKEGTRRNGRGTRHVIGWEDVKGSQAADTDASMAGAGAGEGKGSFVDSKGEETTKVGGRGSNLRHDAVSRVGGNDAGDDGDDRRKRNGGGAGGSSSRIDAASSTGAGGAGQGTEPAQSVYNIQTSDPVLFRSPLLVLKASLRPVSAGFVRSATLSTSIHDNGVIPAPLPPRSSPLVNEDIDMLIAEGDDEDAVDDYPNLFEIPTFLPDVEAAYVDLTRAVYNLPSQLLDSTTTLEPIKSFRKTFVRCLLRDVDNVMNFPIWVRADSSSTPGSSPNSSPIQSATPLGRGGKGKVALNEDQMRRMRDEMTVAQAAIKCATAVFADERVYSILTDAELTSLLATFTTLTMKTDLRVTIQRELFPFVPWLLSEQLLPHSIVSPLLESHILPSLAATLTLNPRTDRSRNAFGVSLTALSYLLSTHPKETIERGRWKIWFKPALLGLWDAPKKAVSGRTRALKVAGRLTRALTAPVEMNEEGREWVRKREQIANEVGEAMLALLSEIPEDAVPIVPVNSLERVSTPTRFQTLSAQMMKVTKAKTANGNKEPVDEAAYLYYVSLLSILPALLGSSFRKLDSSGIGLWIKPFNQLQAATSSPILALSALAWPHLAFAFCRSTSQQAQDVSAPWIYSKRKTGEENKSLIVLTNIFRSQLMVWMKAFSTVTPVTKEKKRTHAKALAMAYASTVYGLTVLVLQGISSDRDPTSATLPALTPLGLEHLDRTFDQLIVPFLPTLTRSSSIESSTIGWKVFSSIVRPQAPSDSLSTLEDIVNPAILDTQLAFAKTAERLDLILAATFAKSIDPFKIPGWGIEWVQTRLGKVLGVFTSCLEAARASTLDGHDECATTWTNLLSSLASNDDSLNRAFDWLIELEASSSAVPSRIVRSLWTAALAHIHTNVARTVERCIEEARGGSGTFTMISTLWRKSAATSTSGNIAASLARGWAKIVSEDETDSIGTHEIEMMVDLLRLHVSAPSTNSDPSPFVKLARALGGKVFEEWTSDPTRASSITATCGNNHESDIRLCTLFFAASHELSSEGQSLIVELSTKALDNTLGSDRASDEIVSLIADMLNAASDTAYPSLYELVLDTLRPTIRPTHDSLSKYLSLLTPSLDRAIHLHKIAEANESPAETFASRRDLRDTLQPLLAFNDFWRETFAESTEDVEIPEKLVDLLSTLKMLAEEVQANVPEDSQFYSQLEQSIKTFAAREQVASAPAAVPTLPSYNVSTRDYYGDVDQSRFHRPTNEDATFAEESTITASRQLDPSASFRGPPRQGEEHPPADSIDSKRESAVIEETPKEIQTMRSRASFASLMSSNAATEVADVEAPADEAMAVEAGAKREGKDKKRKRSPEVPETSPSLVLGSSDEDEVIVVRSSQASSSSNKPARKKVKTTRKRRSAESASVEDDESKPKKSTAVQSRASRRVKGRGKAAQAASVSASSDASTSADVNSDATIPSTSTSTREPRRRPEDEAAVRSVLDLPMGTVVSIGKKIGGRASLQRLMALGELAKDYLERLKH